MMKRASTIFFVLLLCGVLPSIAQNPPQPPKPGPEQKNLNFFAGNWTMSGEVKPGPMGPGGKFTGTEHNEWMPGGFFLLSHTKGSGAGMGNQSGLAVHGYDAEKKVYTYDEFNSSGQNVHATGNFDGKVWTWTSDMTMGGQSMKGRYVLTQTSATACTFKFDMSSDGGKSWTPVMEGTGKKAGAAGVAKKKE
jgi:hypothetical protein